MKIYTEKTRKPGKKLILKYIDEMEIQSKQKIPISRSKYRQQDNNEE